MFLIGRRGLSQPHASAAQCPLQDARCSWFRAALAKAQGGCQRVEQRGWNNVDGPGSLKSIGDEARRQEREEGDMYVSNEEVQLQRKEVAYVSGDEDEDAGNVDMGRRKAAAPRRAIPTDPLETKGSEDEGPSYVTRSRAALGKRSRTDVPEIDKAHPKKRPYLNDRLTSRDLKQFSLSEREKYFMSLPGMSKARTRCERCEELDIACFFPAATYANPNPACIQCRSRHKACPARETASSSAARSSSSRA
ncbi:hypothetical protein DFS33DRAFT_1319843 [Desarmillaria ectypa]|nr:hypothetical protein DFS33DRAFT_1319843 [Desarmillaria ectypa]